MSADTGAGGLQAELRAVPGVLALYPHRGTVVDAAARAVGSLSQATRAIVARDPAGLAATGGGTAADPVLVRVAAEAVSVAVDISVRADDGAADTARAVGAVVQEWCRRTYPGLRPVVSVRIAFID